MYLSFSSRIVFALLTTAMPVLASDGVVEINQTCAVEVGCIDNSGGIGDIAGFPVSIEIPGSYILTSNLVVSDASRHGIFIATTPVTIDLNGFEIRGPVSCAGSGSAVTCGAGSGSGIRGEARPRITVRNGNISGFGSDGLLVAGRSRIESVVAERNGGRGIVTGDDSVVTGSKAYRNASDGILVNDSSVVRECTSASNGDDGIQAGNSAMVVSSTARDNGSQGVRTLDASVVSTVTAFQNETEGISGQLGSTVMQSSAYENGGSGISVNVRSAVLDSMAFRNGGHGIITVDKSRIVGNSAMQNANSGIQAGILASVVGNNLADNSEFGISLREDTTYRENTIRSNFLGAITNPNAATLGVNLGDNYCTGNGVVASTCP